MNQRQHREQEAARKEKRAKAAREKRAEEKRTKMQEALKLTHDLAQHSGGKIYTISCHPPKEAKTMAANNGIAHRDPTEKATGANLQPSPIWQGIANTKGVRIMRPFGVELAAHIQSDGAIGFTFNAEPDEQQCIISPKYATTEGGIVFAIKVAEEVSRRRATKLLKSQGFTEVDPVSIETREA